MIRSRTLNRRLALLASALMLAPQGAFANPLGGQVVGGQATIQGQGTSTVTVTQGSQNAIINWYTFNIGAGETHAVHPAERELDRAQPRDRRARPLADLRPPHGERPDLPDQSGRHPVRPRRRRSTPPASWRRTNDIKNSDFMAGNYKFTIPGRPDASIVNLGTITATNGGFAALVAPGVRNAGMITANLGHVALASGNGFTLDFYGDKLITLQVGDQIASKVIDVATGQTLNALVKNEGMLKANGGQVALTAAAARHVVDSVINNTGVIEANSVGMQERHDRARRRDRRHQGHGCAEADREGVRHAVGRGPQEGHEGRRHPGHRRGHPGRRRQDQCVRAGRRRHRADRRRYGRRHGQSRRSAA